MLTKDPWWLLLAKTKKIKDAVHGDIDLTSTEIRIIDTRQYQRLRYIRQLGPAYLLYPSAQHSRFEHMLGTVFMAQRIIDSVNLNPIGGFQIGSKDVFAVRLVALLHDLAHLPFGHTLEDEGRLFPRQWESEPRQKLLFGPVAGIIRESVKKAFAESGREAEGERRATEVLDTIRGVLIQEETGDVDELNSPYIADIVGNTICADLLDYLKRDAYFTGPPGAYDERVLSYFTIKDVKNRREVQKKRLVIQLSKNGSAAGNFGNTRRREIRHDVLSGLLDMLRLRYSLAERIYYHHAKREASAMIIKMVTAAVRAGIIDEEKLCQLDDISLISYIEHFHETTAYHDLNPVSRGHLQISQKLAERFRSRSLYKPAFELRILEANNEEKARELIDDWQKREDFEQTLAESVGISAEDIIVYIPKEDMGAKTAKTLVELPFGSNRILTLEDLGRKILPAEHKNIAEVVEKELSALDTRHRMLWKLSVYAYPEIGPEKIASIKKLCEEWFGSGEQYALVDMRAAALSKTLTHNEKLRIAGLAVVANAAPSKGSEHMSSFSRLLRIVDSLIETHRT